MGKCGGIVKTPLKMWIYWREKKEKTVGQLARGTGLDTGKYFFYLSKCSDNIF